MNNRQTMIGYNRRVDYKWLEYTANLLNQNMQAKDIYLALSALLHDHLSVGSNPKRGSREKTITILLKTWVNLSKELVPLRNDGLTLLQRLPVADHKSVHWGMSMAAYPFFCAVAETTGRLLRLQETVSAAQVQRRIKEKYGQRETAARSARYVLRAFIDWKVLRETGQKGIYCQTQATTISDLKLIGWLVEASLRAGNNGSAALRDILDAPSMFPFQLCRITANHLVTHSPRLDILRHGLDDTLIMLNSDDKRN